MPVLPVSDEVTLGPHSCSKDNENNSGNLYTFAAAYLQGRVRIPIGGKVREPKGMSRCDYGTDSVPGRMRTGFPSGNDGYSMDFRCCRKPGKSGWKKKWICSP